MGLISRGSQPTIEWERVTRATEPRLRGPVPGINSPIENANLILNKQVLTLNRAGSHPKNPILAGLGIRSGFQVGLKDRLTGVFIYQDRRSIGNNLAEDAPSGGPGLYTVDMLAGSGQTKAGTPASGAIRNFLRWSSVFGTVEREFWIKSYDYDIVTVGDLPALDPDTLLPVERAFPMVDASRDWLDIPIDFFVSWNDEFQEMHRLVTEGTPEGGFLKAYGGAVFVSFFDTTPGTEGVGVQVNPVTQNPVKDQQIIQVENTAGLKSITVRFRSKEDSLYFVDVPILIRVLPPPADNCLPPIDEPCCQELILHTQTIEANTPDEPSVPGVQVVAGTPGTKPAKDLLIVGIHAAAVGSAPTLLVRKFELVQDLTNIGGSVYQQVDTDLEFLPLRTPAASPVEAPPYQAPLRLVIAFDIGADRAAHVALYVISVKDDVHLSAGRPFTGPAARDLCFFPKGETGGQDPCIYG